MRARLNDTREYPRDNHRIGKLGGQPAGLAKHSVIRSVGSRYRLIDAIRRNVNIFFVDSQTFLESPADWNALRCSCVGQNQFLEYTKLRSCVPVYERV